MNTKRDRAEAAVRAMTRLSEEAHPSSGLYFSVGLLQGYAENSGYLPAARIDKIIQEASGRLDGFMAAYEQELGE